MIRDLDATLGRSGGMRGQAVGYTIAAVAEGIVFALLVPILRALFDRDPAAAVPWLIGAAMAGLVCGLTQWITENRSYHLAVDTTGGVMHRLGKHAARIPLGWFTKENTGRLNQLVTGSAVQLMHLPGLVLSQSIRSAVTPLTVLLVTIVVDWRMALAMAALIPIGVLAYRNVVHTAAVEHEHGASADAELSARVIEYAQAQPVLRAAGRREEGWQRLDAALAASRDATVRQLQRSSRPTTRYAGVVQLGFALVAAAGVLLATAGSLAVPDLLAILVLAVRFVEPLSTLAAYGEGAQLARDSLARIRDALDVPPLPEPEAPRVPAGSAIELDGVVFGYGEQPVLHGIDLAIPEGSVTALVGPSGSGKTTITRLIARFWDVDRGAIRIGGVDVRNIGTENLMPRIAMVFQQVYLFDGTIAENVRLARPDATDDEVRAAGTAAGLDEVVTRLPHGWDARVGEGGSLLSGGERQRVSIARALLKDAPIVLLDEVTSALDAENEAAVTEAIRRLAHGRTVVIIAHRLSTIAGADQIVYLDGGRVVEAGRHEELLTANGHYTRLWAERIGAEGWQITKADRG